MDYANYTSFPPIQPVLRVVSAFERVDKIHNEVQSVQYVEYNNTVKSSVTVQVYDQSGAVVEYQQPQNILDLFV